MSVATVWLSMRSRRSKPKADFSFCYNLVNIVDFRNGIVYHKVINVYLIRSKERKSWQIITVIWFMKSRT